MHPFSIELELKKEDYWPVCTTLHSACRYSRPARRMQMYAFAIGSGSLWFTKRFWKIQSGSRIGSYIRHEWLPSGPSALKLFNPSSYDPMARMWWVSPCDVVFDVTLMIDDLRAFGIVYLQCHYPLRLPFVSVWEPSFVSLERRNWYSKSLEHALWHLVRAILLSFFPPQPSFTSN